MPSHDSEGRGSIVYSGCEYNSGISDNFAIPPCTTRLTSFSSSPYLNLNATYTNTDVAFRIQSPANTYHTPSFTSYQIYIVKECNAWVWEPISNS
eukprot:scaffold313_cov242-Alexandrium_tamarense.AAC.1